MIKEEEECLTDVGVCSALSGGGVAGTGGAARFTRLSWPSRQQGEWPPRHVAAPILHWSSWYRIHCLECITEKEYLNKDTGEL